MEFVSPKYKISKIYRKEKNCVYKSKRMATIYKKHRAVLALRKVCVYLRGRQI